MADRCDGNAVAVAQRGQPLALGVDPARACYSAMLGAGDPDDVLRGADAADLADRHNERAAIYEYDGGLDRPAATARALARLIEQLTRRNPDD